MRVKGCKITLKTEKPTGRYRSFDNDYITLQYKGESFGFVSEVSREEDSETVKKYLIRVKKPKTEEERIKGSNPNCYWKMVLLKGEYNTKEDLLNFIASVQTQLIGYFDKVIELEKSRK